MESHFSSQPVRPELGSNFDWPTLRESRMNTKKSAGHRSNLRYFVRVFVPIRIEVSRF